jgi:single-strand DNA-binding protein
MSSLNKVLIIGNLGQDPELKDLPSGSKVAKLRLATTRGWTDKDSGERKEETEWHDVEVFGKEAEVCAEHLAKGRQVYVEGRIKTDRWEDKESKEKRYRTKIIADRVEFLGAAPGAGLDAANDADPAEASAPKPPAKPNGPPTGRPEFRERKAARG